MQRPISVLIFKPCTSRQVTLLRHRKRCVTSIRFSFCQVASISLKERVKQRIVATILVKARQGTSRRVDPRHFTAVHRNESTGKRRIHINRRIPNLNPIQTGLFWTFSDRGGFGSSPPPPYETSRIFKQSP